MGYQELYALQDDILDIVFGVEHEFYLTGGTALHRFYYDGRYSDDLDFFVTNGVQFSEDVQELIDVLIDKKYSVYESIKSRDFYRIVVNDMLQVDFVNDRVYRQGKSNIFSGYRIDNKINILTNKINTIVSRDEEKDVFDLFCLAYNENFNWKEIFEIANKKAIVEKDIFVYRIKNFPLHWLGKVKNIADITISKQHIDKLCEDIILDKDNSLKNMMKH